MNESTEQKNIKNIYFVSPLVLYLLGEGLTVKFDEPLGKYLFKENLDEISLKIIANGNSKDIDKIVSILKSWHYANKTNPGEIKGIDWLKVNEFNENSNDFKFAFKLKMNRIKVDLVLSSLST